MQPGQPSLTALGAARLRAAHQLLDAAAILTDPLAERILCSDTETTLAHAAAHPAGPRLRWFIAARSRIAEDRFNAAVADGARQLVVLGAGLDTLAYRTQHRDRLRLFEVDHPATQAWKRDKLVTAAIAVPETLRFVPVDFERQLLDRQLIAAGFDPSQRSFFVWLGVVPYLTETAVFSTLGFIAGCAGGAEVVFDYVNPIGAVAPAARAAHQALADRVSSLGEPMQTYLETDALCARLRAIGFADLDDIGPAQLVATFFPETERASPGRGGHVMCAAAREKVTPT